VQSKSNATAILACTAASKAAISTKPAPRFKHYFHLLPKSDRKKPLHMTQVSNDDDSSKGTAVHTSKKKLLFTFSVSYLQNTILKKGQNTFMTYILFNRFTKNKKNKT